MYVNDGHKTYVQDINVSKVEKIKKIQIIQNYILQISTLPLTKRFYTNFPPKNDYSHIQNYFPFFSRVTKGKSVK